jgi:hypothetical protein
LHRNKQTPVASEEQTGGEFEMKYFGQHGLRGAKIRHFKQRLQPQVNFALTRRRGGG